jgi:hypothetical protein
MEAAAKLLKPVLNKLFWQAPQGSVMHNEDTSMRILTPGFRYGRLRHTGTSARGIV